MKGRAWVPLLAGAVLGPVLQVQQRELWAFGPYAAIFVIAGLVLLAVLVGRRRIHGFAVLLLAATLAFGVCGARAAVFVTRALSPALEGRDLHVTGTIVAMPQSGELGQRFRFEVEQAFDGGRPVVLPPRLSLAWYPSEPERTAPVLFAGERWRLTVRLRAPHGHANPHGFDHELWLWEQGLQATGYVRAGPARSEPQRLGPTLRHPVEQARQSVRDAILARLADRPAAGVVAALVTGDQAAIDLVSTKCVLICPEARFRGEGQSPSSPRYKTVLVSLS